MSASHARRMAAHRSEMSVAVWRRAWKDSASGGLQSSGEAARYARRHSASRSALAMWFDLLMPRRAVAL